MSWAWLVQGSLLAWLVGCLAEILRSRFYWLDSLLKFFGGGPDTKGLAVGWESVVVLDKILSES